MSPIKGDKCMHHSGLLYYTPGESTKQVSGVVYKASPNTEQIQYMDLFSHLTVRLPSVLLSQKHDAAVCSPAPVFCRIRQVTMYLNGLLSVVKRLIQLSRHSLVHSDTMSASYCWDCSVLSRHSLMMLLTSSATKTPCRRITR